MLMTPQVLLVWIGGFFALIVFGAVVLFVLAIFFDRQDPTAGIFANNSFAANATDVMQQGIFRVFEQMPNVGRLAGVSLIIGVMGLLGIGAYMGYTKVKGM